MLSNYDEAAKRIIPAMRIFIAKELKKRYDMKEEDIASRLEVAQAAISKYLSNKYSTKLNNVIAKINAGKVDKYIAKIANGDRRYTNIAICTACKDVNKFDCMFAQTKKNNNTEF